MARMMILRNLYTFNVPEEDLVLIYWMYIRSVIEFNCSVWFSSITQDEKNDLERIQKVACKIIPKDSYSNYYDALKRLNIQNLSDWRTMLPTRFASKCTQHDKFKSLFHRNGIQSTRKKEKYYEKFASKQKLHKSAIPSMQRLINRKKWIVHLWW